MNNNNDIGKEPLASVPQPEAVSSSATSGKCECDGARVAPPAINTSVAPLGLSAESPSARSSNSPINRNSNSSTEGALPSSIGTEAFVPSVPELSRRQAISLTPEQRYKLAVIAKIVSAYSAMSNGDSEDEDSFSDYDDEDEDAEYDEQLNDDTVVFSSLAHMLGVREKQLMNVFENLDGRTGRFIDFSRLSRSPSSAAVFNRRIAEAAVAPLSPLVSLSSPSVSISPAPAPVEEAKPVQKNRRKCWECSKKVPLTAVTCRCDYTFCTSHRMAESHKCTFDYKLSNKRKLAEQNPVVRAAKVAKIC